MKTLVTGATGFLGRAVVQSLLQRGHEVRAMVRPTRDTSRLPQSDRLEVYGADLRGGADLVPAFDGVDVLVHLAAQVQGSDEARFHGTVVATERLLKAMAETDTERLVLASSFSVYDWNARAATLDENIPLESRLYERDGYAIAKAWQERVVRRWAEEHGWPLTVLRPGFIWGAGNPWVDAAGIPAGRLLVVNGPLRRLALTHVENCADCFSLAAEHTGAQDAQQATGETFNVVDGDEIRAWRFTGDYTRAVSGQLRLPVPYHLILAAVYCAGGVARVCFGPNWRLPGVLVPLKHRARFRPWRFSADKAKRILGWQPRAYRTCVSRAFDGATETANSPPASRPPVEQTAS